MRKLNDSQLRNAAERIEVITVWYATFTTIMDTLKDGDYTKEQAIEKLKILREKLAETVPDVEAGIGRFKVTDGNYRKAMKEIG